MVAAAAGVLVETWPLVFAVEAGATGTVLLRWVDDAPPTDETAETTEGDRL